MTGRLCARVFLPMDEGNQSKKEQWEARFTAQRLYQWSELRLVYRVTLLECSARGPIDSLLHKR